MTAGRGSTNLPAQDRNLVLVRGCQDVDDFPCDLCRQRLDFSPEDCSLQSNVLPPEPPATAILTIWDDDAEASTAASMTIRASLWDDGQECEYLVFPNILHHNKYFWGVAGRCAVVFPNACGGIFGDFLICNPN